MIFSLRKGDVCYNACYGLVGLLEALIGVTHQQLRMYGGLMNRLFFSVSFLPYFVSGSLYPSHLHPNHSEERV